MYIYISSSSEFDSCSICSISIYVCCLVSIHRWQPTVGETNYEKKAKNNKKTTVSSKEKIPSFIWAFYLEWTRNYRRQPCSQSTNEKGVAFVSIFRKLQFSWQHQQERNGAVTAPAKLELGLHHVGKFPKW